MNSFSPRFFRVPQQSVDDTTSFLRRQPSLSDIQDHHDHNNRQQSDDDDDDDFDSIDGDTDPEDTTDTDGFLDDGDLEASMTDSDYESQDNGDYTEDDDDDDALPIKVVARVKNGTIMNGKGEFVNKGIDDRASHSSWLDEARTNRKVRCIIER
jgi:hypothetical protein